MRDPPTASPCRQQAANAGNTFYSVKRLIGQEYEAVEEEAQGLAYTVTSDEDGFVALDCPNSEGGGWGVA